MAEGTLKVKETFVLNQWLTKCFSKFAFWILIQLLSCSSKSESLSILVLHPLLDLLLSFCLCLNTVKGESS